MSSYRERVFCAFCKNPKYIRKQKHIDWTNGLISLVAALASMFVFWQSFDPRFLLLWSVYLGISEIFVYLNWRASVRCDSCAFDPVLYRSNPAKAAGIVKAHLEELKLSGSYLLKRNNPFEHLAVQKKKASDPKAPEPKAKVDLKEKATVQPTEDKDRLLSRQV